MNSYTALALLYSSFIERLFLFAQEFAHKLIYLKERVQPGGCIALPNPDNVNNASDFVFD